MSRDWHRSGFTLIELLIVIGIIGTLASVTIVAINPNKQLGSAKDAARLSAIKETRNALIQYQIDNGSFPAGIPAANPKPVCKAGVTTDATCVNLDVLVPKYLVALPQDTRELNANYTGYLVYTNAGRAEVVATYLGNFISGGLVDYWKMDDTSGTIATDSSGYGHNATITNGTWSTGKIGGALNLTAGYAVHSTAGISPAAGTVSMWVLPGFNGATDYAGLWQTRDDNIPNQPKWISTMLYAGVLYFRIMDDAGNLWDATVSGNGIFTNGTWVHLAFTWNSASSIIYVNGVQVATRVTPGLPTSLDALGRVGFGHQYPMTGKMDDVRIYNRALTQAEIQALAAGNG